MKDQYENFTARAKAWAAEHPEEMISYKDGINLSEAKMQTFCGQPELYTYEDIELIGIIEDWEALMEEYNRELDMTPLPYSFDLLHDIKHMYEVEMVCKGQHPAGTDATPEDLLEMFIDHKLEIPEYLEEACKGYNKGETVIWVCNNGTWLTYQPLPDEIHNYVRTKIALTEEFKKGLRHEI